MHRFPTLILNILNDEDNFTKLCNEFHNGAPLLVIENFFLPVCVCERKC